MNVSHSGLNTSKMQMPRRASRQARDAMRLARVGFFHVQALRWNREYLGHAQPQNNSGLTSMSIDSCQHLFSPGLALSEDSLNRLWEECRRAPLGGGLALVSVGAQSLIVLGHGLCASASPAALGFIGSV
jgi:hypothetical protein